MLLVGFPEPIAWYAAAEVVSNSNKTSVAALERARNEAVRIRTGCVKSAPVAQLWKLVNLPTMEEMASSQAAKLYERSMRMGRETPLGEALHQITTTKMRKKRSTMKMMAEKKLADISLLQLHREPMPAQTCIRSTRNADFHFATCRKDNPAEIQRKAAEKLLQHIGQVDCEAWEDGSVGNQILGAKYLSSTRAAGKWGEEWFNGTVRE